VNARAVEGQATEAALRALAEALGVRRSDMRLVTGATSRDKVVDIMTSPGSDESLLLARLGELREGKRSEKPR
jgi:uncharacterized protein YggU (UPF0235/DUF167 family)